MDFNVLHSIMEAYAVRIAYLGDVIKMKTRAVFGDKVIIEYNHRYDTLETLAAYFIDNEGSFDEYDTPEGFIDTLIDEAGRELLSCKHANNLTKARCNFNNAAGDVLIQILNGNSGLSR